MTVDVVTVRDRLRQRIEDDQNLLVAVEVMVQVGGIDRAVEDANRRKDQAVAAEKEQLGRYKAAEDKTAAANARLEKAKSDAVTAANEANAEAGRIVAKAKSDAADIITQANAELKALNDRIGVVAGELAERQRELAVTAKKLDAARSEARRLLEEV